MVYDGVWTPYVSKKLPANDPLPFLVELCFWWSGFEIEVNHLLSRRFQFSRHPDKSLCQDKVQYNFFEHGYFVNQATKSKVFV